jgi:tetratricopeptide (TPR) repeat protein
MLILTACLFFPSCRESETVDHAARGRKYGEKGDYDKAVSEFTKALENDPNLEIIYVNRALAYFRKSEYDRSIAD